MSKSLIQLSDAGLELTQAPRVLSPAADMAALETSSDKNTQGDDAIVPDQAIERKSTVATATQPIISTPTVDTHPTALGLPSAQSATQNEIVYQGPAELEKSKSHAEEVLSVNESKGVVVHEAIQTENEGKDPLPNGAPVDNRHTEESDGTLVSLHALYMTHPCTQCMSYTNREGRGFCDRQRCYSKNL